MLSCVEHGKTFIFSMPDSVHSAQARIIPMICNIKDP